MLISHQLMGSEGWVTLVSLGSPDPALIWKVRPTAGRQQCACQVAEQAQVLHPPSGSGWTRCPILSHVGAPFPFPSSARLPSSTPFQTPCPVLLGSAGSWRQAWSPFQFLGTAPALPQAPTSPQLFFLTCAPCTPDCFHFMTWEGE